MGLVFHVTLPIPKEQQLHYLVFKDMIYWPSGFLSRKLNILHNTRFPPHVVQRRARHDLPGQSDIQTFREWSCDSVKERDL